MAIDTKANIQTDINTKLADNAAGEISAQDSREVHEDIKDSALMALDAQEYERALNFNETTLTDAANISWDLDLNQVTEVTLTASRTLDNPTNMKAGGTYILRVVQDGVGGHTLAYGTAYRFPSGTAPTLSTGASAVDYLTFICDGTNMDGVFQGDFS